MKITQALLDTLTEQAKAFSPVCTYNFQQSLEDKYHRMLNAVEHGTVIPIHKTSTKYESFSKLSY